MYDTKHLCRGHLPDVLPDTSLGGLFTALLEGGRAAEVADFLLRCGVKPSNAALQAALQSGLYGGGAYSHGAATGGGGDVGGNGAHAVAPAHVMPYGLPPVRHAPGFEEYAAGSRSGKAHEAGFDAYMTGVHMAVVTSFCFGDWLACCSASVLQAMRAAY